jgi:histidinol-phosphate aminotransferase
MTRTAYATPAARQAIIDPGLSRPDWTKGSERNPDLLWLDKNENSDPALNEITRRVLAEVDPRNLYSYPESAELYRKLAAYLDLAPENLLLAAGSDGAIRSVFEAYVERDDRIVHTVPTFAMYPVYARMYGAKRIGLEYARSSREPLLLVDSVVKAISEAQPRVVCLPNPDSPTGTVFEPEDLRRIIEAAGEVGAVMLVDEAYHPFYPETVVPWVGEYPHLVVARTFAKAWGMAGLRIGYAVGGPELIRLLHKVRPMYEVNTVAVAAMTRMFDFADEMEASVQRLNAGRDYFLDQMEQLGLATIRARGNFLHVSFGEKASAVHEALSGLVLYRKDSADVSLRGYSRFSATTIDLFRPLVERIRRVYQ